jgi:hypothetical protein
MLSLTKQLAAARRPGCLDKSRYDTWNTQFCAAPSRGPGNQLVEHKAGTRAVIKTIFVMSAASGRNAKSRPAFELHGARCSRRAACSGEVRYALFRWRDR